MPHDTPMTGHYASEPSMVYSDTRTPTPLPPVSSQVIFQQFLQQQHEIEQTKKEYQVILAQLEKIRQATLNSKIQLSVQLANHPQ